MFQIHGVVFAMPIAQAIVFIHFETCPTFVNIIHWPTYTHMVCIGQMMKYLFIPLSYEQGKYSSFIFPCT